MWRTPRLEHCPQCPAAEGIAWLLHGGPVVVVLKQPGSFHGYDCDGYDATVVKLPSDFFVKPNGTVLFLAMKIRRHPVLTFNLRPTTAVANVSHVPSLTHSEAFIKGSLGI